VAGGGERSDMTSSSVRENMFCDGMGRNLESGRDVSLTSSASSADSGGVTSVARISVTT
jgi:hypothetical protein